jgi:negative regulator of flagellin synthesis FlgM
MSTKIEGYSTNGNTPVSAPRTADSGNTAPGANSASVQRVDSVKLTPDAMQLHQLEKSIASIPVADLNRVAKVRQAIHSGSYQIDPRKIAAKLTRMEWDLARTP